jgi:hypothetical protein
MVFSRGKEKAQSRPDTSGRLCCFVRLDDEQAIWHDEMAAITGGKLK